MINTNLRASRWEQTESRAVRGDQADRGGRECEQGACLLFSVLSSTLKDSRLKSPVKKPTETGTKPDSLLPREAPCHPPASRPWACGVVCLPKGPEGTGLGCGPSNLVPVTSPVPHRPHWRTPHRKHTGTCARTGRLSPGRRLLRPPPCHRGDGLKG